MTRRLAYDQQDAVILAGAAALGLAAAAALLVQPALAFLIALSIPLAAYVPRFRPEHLVAGLIAYLPFENLVLTWVHGSAGNLPPSTFVAIRYTPEILVYIVGLALIVLNFERVVDRIRRFSVPFGLVLAAWAGSMVWNAVSLSTGAIGFRSEFRFLLLLVIPLLARAPMRDARLYAKTLVVAAVVESFVVIAQFVGGESVRAHFVPDWEVVIGGVALADSGPIRLDTIFGTFSNYNALGIFLVFAWIALVAAGRKELGLSRATSLSAGTLIALAIVLSGSRESAIALVVAAAVIIFLRFRSALVPIGAFLAVCAAIAAPWWTSPPDTGTTPRSGGSIVQRWESLLHPRTWSPDYRANFRLFLLASNTKLVASESPLFGFGLGTVTDKRTVNYAKNPLHRTYAGRRALQFRYAYDGNWGLLLLEVGFLGLFALAWLLGALAWLGASLRKVHWIGPLLLGYVVAIAILGFFAPVIQLRVPSAVLWLAVGLALAIYADRKADGPARDEVPSV